MVKSKFVRFIVVAGNLAVAAFLQPIMFVVCAVYEAIRAVIYKFDFEDYLDVLSGYWQGLVIGLESNSKFICTGDLDVFFNIFKD